jgi:hypothetical protein
MLRVTILYFLPTHFLLGDDVEWSSKTDGRGAHAQHMTPQAASPGGSIFSNRYNGHVLWRIGSAVEDNDPNEDTWLGI